MNLWIEEMIFSLKHTRPSSSHISNLSNNCVVGLTYNSFCLLPHHFTYTFSIAFSPSFVYNTIIMPIKEKRNTMSHTCCFFQKTSLSWRKNTRKRLSRNQHGKSCIPWRSELFPFEFLKDVAERVKKAMFLRSVRRSSNRGSSSMGRSKPMGASVDYYRTAAVEDCIEFIHSSFSRSNSLTATPGQEITHTLLRN